MRQNSRMVMAAVLAAMASGAAAAPAAPLAAPAAPTVPAVRQPSELEQAQTLLRSGRAEEALALLDPLVAKAVLGEAKDPKATCPGVAIALLQRMMGKGVTITLPNDYCEAMLARGYALTELKRYAEAEQMLGILVGHDPNNPQYLIEYAFAVRSTGDNARALSLYTQAEQLAARLPDRDASRLLQAAALRGRGFTLSDLQRWDEAVRAYRKSQKFDPNNAIAAHELTWIAQNRPH